MAHKKYILAHDTGTGGNKAVLCDLKGKVIHSAYQTYGISYPHPEWVEQDPDELWRVVAATSKRVIREIGNRRGGHHRGRRLGPNVEYTSR